MPRYRKKPIEVEAVLYDGTPETCLAIHEWLGIEHASSDVDCASGIYIDTAEGLMEASVGDYIIAEPFPSGDRKFYPVKPSIFEATYERVES